MQKTAKEMFEELGYEIFGSNAKYICYRNIKNAWFIEFDLDKKCILTNKPNTIFNLINLGELQAINKQVEELGWNNENS